MTTKCVGSPMRKETPLRGTTFVQAAEMACCFGTASVAAVWRAEEIPALPVLTKKTKSRLYCEYQQGIQQSPSQACKTHPRDSAAS